MLFYLERDRYYTKNVLSSKHLYLQETGEYYGVQSKSVGLYGRRDNMT